MRLARLAIVLLAVLAAFVPLPASLVETYYSQRTYLSLQNILTPWSSTVPFALLDVAGAVLLAILTVVFWRRTRKRGLLRALTSTTATILITAALVYVAFLALWGLNYRRPALESKLAFDASRLTREGVRTLGERAVREVNAAYAPAHASVPGGSLEAAYASAQRQLGASRLAVPAAAKRSVLELYFRRAAIDGMTDPFFLEVIVNPDTLPFERPFVMLHEWAHLAGYAHEAEANFFAWLACMQGDSLARYSGWLAVYEHVAATLPRDDRAALAASLDAGPRKDLAAAAARYARSSPVVRDASRDVYDTYLRANRVAEGIASYSGVVRLMVGAGVGEGVVPAVAGIP